MDQAVRLPVVRDNLETFEPHARAWRDRGALESVGGIDCFTVDIAGAHADVPVLWLHGFPSSSLDWHAVIARLEGTRRMLLMDFPGFGFSAKPAGSRYSYSLIDQADRVLLWLARLNIRRLHLIAHDMGTSVACEMLARRAAGSLPVKIDSLVLSNGSVFIEQARLTPSQKLLRSPLARCYARIARWPLFRWQLGRIVEQPLAKPELRAMWQLLNHNNGVAALPATIRYIDERYRLSPRWTTPLASLDIPVRILWGRRDPVAVPAIAERLARTIPGAELVWLESCGHFPMLEAPEAFAAAVGEFLDLPSGRGIDDD